MLRQIVPSIFILDPSNGQYGLWHLPDIRSPGCLELGKRNIVPTGIAPLPNLPPHGGSTGEGKLKGGRGGGGAAGGPPPEEETIISKETNLYICVFLLFVRVSAIAVYPRSLAKMYVNQQLTL